MRILSIIQPSEMGSDFRFEDGFWKVNFPAGMGDDSGLTLSTDDNNAITTGSDEGVFISKDLLSDYALIQDNGSKEIKLYRFPAGTEFDVETATLVSSVNLIELSGVFDDVAIDGEVITFTDADTGLTLSLDTANLQKVSDIVGSDAISVSSIDGETRIEVRIDPNPNNLIQLSEGGLIVDPSYLGGGDVNLHQTLAEVENGLCHVVGNSHLVVPQIELTDIAGNPIGYINDLIGLPVSSTTEDDDHCPNWQPPVIEGGNCRVGKTAVVFTEDILYNYRDGLSVTWRIYINGIDTGFVASAESDVGNGYLEGAIIDASGGDIEGKWKAGLSFWNRTNRQQLIKLVPDRDITIEEFQNRGDGTDLVEIWGTENDAIYYIDEGGRIQNYPNAQLEKLEDYIDEENGGAITICLAPINGGSSGSEGGLQISCYGATDRFMTSGIFGNWTLKINGKTIISNSDYGLVLEALGNHNVLVNDSSDSETAFRNMGNEDIRIELIAQNENESDGYSFLRIMPDSNPTLAGYNPLPDYDEDPITDIAAKRFQHITVCLAPFNEWMHWDYREIDGSSVVVTLTNSVNLVNVDQSFRLKDDDSYVIVDTDTNIWGDFTWHISSYDPTHEEVVLTINSTDYSDEYVLDFISRRPMRVILKNTHEYSRTITVNNPFPNPSTIESISIVGKKGVTLITEPEDGLIIDGVVGSVRVDDLENNEFSYIVQGRFVETELSDVMKVKFVTASGEELIETVQLTTEGNTDFSPVSQDLNSRILVGLIDSNSYSPEESGPLVRVISPEWAEATIDGTKGKGGEASLAFDFSDQYTREILIYGNLSGCRLAVIGDCVVGVEDWGELNASAITFNRETYSNRFEEESIDFTSICRNNLMWVPKESPEGLESMVGMFAGTDLSDPAVDLSAYDVGGVYSMAGAFANSGFNGDIKGWNMRWVNSLGYMFYGSNFRQDLSLWCVPNVHDEPIMFSYRSPLQAKHKPVWGTCPLGGNNNSNEWGEFSLRGEVEYHNIRGYGLIDDFIGVHYTNFTKAGPLVGAVGYTPMRFLGKRCLKDQEINKLALLEGLILIDDQALMNNQLTQVTIPASVKIIGFEAFAGNPMTSINLVGAVPPSLGLGGLPETVTSIYVPDEAIATYVKHKDWKIHAGKIKPLSEANGVIYLDKQGTMKFLEGPVIAEDALENKWLVILSINEGVTTLGSDALIGNTAHHLKIPNSLTTTGSASLNVDTQILEFLEGRTSNDFMIDSRLSAGVLILPSTMTAVNGTLTGSVPRVIMSKALVPPTLGNWYAYQATSTNTEYSTSLGRWYSLAGNNCEVLYVPAAAVEAYRNDPQWSMFTDNILPIEGVTYGNVKTINLRDWGEEYIVSGTADLASVGKEVTIRYFENSYNNTTGRTVPINITNHSTVVKADGTFSINILAREELNSHFFDAVIGAGNRLIANTY